MNTPDVCVYIYICNQINIFMSFHQLKHPHHVLINHYLHILKNSWYERIPNLRRSMSWDPYSATKSPMDINVWTPALSKIWQVSGVRWGDGEMGRQFCICHLQICKRTKPLSLESFRNLTCHLVKLETQPSCWGTSLPAWRYEASEIWESPHKRTSCEVWQISVSRIANYNQLPSFTTESGTLARQWWPNHRHLAKWDSSNITSWFWVDFLHNLQLSSAALVINQFSLKRLGRPLQNSSLNQTRNRSQDRQRTTRRWVHQTPLPRLSSCHILFRKIQC